MGRTEQAVRYLKYQKYNLYVIIDFGLGNLIYEKQEVSIMDNQILAHTKYNCTYHIVFIPKYRMKVMYGKSGKEVGL